MTQPQKSNSLETQKAHIDGAKKRHYKPRARACKMCKTVFTPKRSAGRFCSTKCRVAHHRAEKLRLAAKAGQVVKPICEWCGLSCEEGKRFCSNKHRRAAWNARRKATVETFVSINLKYLEREKVLDLIEQTKLRKIRKVLEKRDWVYSPQKREWIRKTA